MIELWVLARWRSPPGAVAGPFDAMVETPSAVAQPFDAAAKPFDAMAEASPARWPKPFDAMASPTAPELAEIQDACAF